MASGKGAAHPGAVEPSFAEAAHEAQLLLRFAARNGIALDEACVAAVVAAAGAVDGGAVPPDVQQAFWPAFRSLARAVAPVTVESIRATMDSAPASASTLWLRLRGRPMALARWCSFQYRWLAVLTLLAVIAIQIFWVIGTSIIDDTVTLERQVVALSQQIQQLQGSDAAPPAGPVSIEDLMARQQEREQWLIANYQSLRAWNAVWARMFFIVRPPFASSEFARLRPPAQNRVHVNSASFVLQALSNYVLPLLYGLLGACAYVLRDLSREIREVTFTPGANIRYGLRLALGPLAGIAVGLLIAPEAAPSQASEVHDALAQTATSAGGPGAHGLEPLSLGALGPLALAFLAGYSVELVFTAMDRIIGAFTSDARRGPGPPPPGGGKQGSP